MRQQQAAGEAAQLQAVEENRKRILAEHDAKVAAEKKACDDSRADRLAHAKEMLAARMAAEARVLKHSKAIVAACKLGQKRTGAVTVQSSNGGFRVAPELADDVSCSSLPAGITKDEAYVILFRWRERGDTSPKGAVLQPEDHSEHDSECRSFDVSVGLDLDAASFDDISSVDKVAKWKPAN